MALQLRKTRRILKVCLILAAASLALVYWALRHGPSRHEFTTQRLGEPRHTWRSMRTAWTFQPTASDGSEAIEDLRSGPNGLYYVSTDEAGCLEKSSGKPIWRYRLASPQAAAAGFSTGQVWHLATDDRLVYVCGCEMIRGASAAPYRVCVLNAQTGAPVWQRYYTTGLLCAPCPAGSLVLLTDVLGKVTAVRQDDGSTVWQRAMTVTNFSGKNERPQMTLQVADGIGVTQIGGQLLGFRLSDGQQIWERRCKDETALQAENGASEGFALKDGIVYALLENSEMVAIQAATGKPVWTRQAGGGFPSSPVWLQGDYVFTRPSDFTEPSNPLVAQRRSDGATVWLAGQDPPPPAREDRGLGIILRSPYSSGNQYTLYPGDTQHTLFEVAACEPVLDGVQRRLRSVETLGTVIARDPATGSEQWRWQPNKGTQIVNLIPDGDRLIISDGRRLYAFEEGMPDPLPTDSHERRQLIRRMMNVTFQWPVLTPPADPVAKIVHRLLGPVFKAPPPVSDDIDGTEAQLTLLRLGHDSVSPLLDFIRHRVDDGNAQITASGISPAHDVSDGNTEPALDLLFDIDSPTTPPLLARELDRARDPGTQQSLAHTLIRWDDPRALPALFRYVKSGSEEDAREDSLYSLCRCIDAETAAGHSVSPGRANITTYLLARLNDPKAPDWLRGFARFALLNDRGDAAYWNAFATFKQGRTACLLPTNSALRVVKSFDSSKVDRGFPTEFAPDSICRDEAGTWWAAFACNYFGISPWNRRSNLWIAQSRDKKHWIRPAFGFDLQKQCAARGFPGSIELTYRQGRLCLDWVEEAWIPDTPRQKKTRHHNEVTLADLYRDSDHDGLPDRLEEEIGTDPHNADTNGNGIPDNEDKNPAYRPHVLTEEEGIYQAVIEGLCRYGYWLSTTAKYPQYWSDRTFPFGTSAKPLVLPAPTGSTGVEILGHPGPVLFVPYKAETSLTTGFFYSSRFQHPFIGLDGRWQGRQAMSWESPSTPPTDPFAPQFVAGGDHESHRSFRDYFPYALSADHKRARVGWELEASFEGTVGYDIEVDKIGGHWLPVEFRFVYGTSSHGSWHATVPVAR